MGSWQDQLRQVLRRLIRTPMFTAVTLLTLAVGVGANTAVFSVLDGVLLKPLPYPHADELVGVWHSATGINLPELNMAASHYFIYREQSRAFQAIGMWQSDSVSVTRVGEPERVPARNVTQEVLPIFAVPPMLGRWFDGEDCSPQGPDTAILTYGYWSKKFGGDGSAIGRQIAIDGKPTEIVGVMPQNFHFLDWQDQGLILPVKLDRSKVFLGQYNYEGVARLKPGVTLAQAHADIARMLPIVMQTFPAPPGFSADLFKNANIQPLIRPLKRDVVGDIGKFLWVLMAGIGAVLLIACANVANLMLVRAEGRQQELTVRAGLGASRGRIAAELLFESFIIGLLGSVVGLAMALAALKFLVYLAPSGLPRIDEIGINLPVLAFTLAVALAASLLFGLIPVFKYAGARAGTSLREGGRSLSQSRERHRARNTLVVVQVGLAFVLLIGSGLMLRTFVALTHVNPGFIAPKEVQTFRIAINDTEVSKDEAVIPMQREIQRRLAAVPGVSSVALANSVPMDENNWTDILFPEDRNYSEGELPPLRRFKFVSPEYFQTLGIPILAGRVFTWEETLNRLPVAMISEKFARDFWGDPRSAIGKRIRVSSKDDWREVIGVTANIQDDGMNKPAPGIAFWPLFLKNFESSPVQTTRYVAYAIRSPRAGSENFMEEIRQAVWSVDANLPLAQVRTLDYYYSDSIARTSFTLVMLGIAGGMALLLGTIGLYGVIAYSVSQRTREIGIRIALGAQLGELAGMFVRHGLLLAGIGVGCGAVVAIAAMRLMSSLLFHVSPVDPITYGAVSLGLIGTAALASYVPSRRAARVDPVDALRAE